MTELQDRFYIFEPSDLHESVLTALATMAQTHSSSPQNMTVLVSTLLDQLVRDHPQVTLNTNFMDKREWVFNNAGGAMGSMFMVHSSITE